MHNHYLTFVHRRFASLALAIVTLAFSEPARAMIDGEQLAPGELEAVGSVGENACTATLVTRTLAVTAGHCLCPATDKDGKIPSSCFKPSDVNIRFGSDIYTGVGTLHPLFSANEIRHDLAVIEFDQPVMSSIKPLTIAPPQQRAQAGSVVTVVSRFIHDEACTGDYNGANHRAKEKIISESRNNTKWPQKGSRTINWSNLPKRYCPGDSGSPALDGNNQIVGLVSRGAQVTAGGGRYQVRAFDPSQAHDWIFGRRDTAPKSIASYLYDQTSPAIAYNQVEHEYLLVWEDHYWGWGNDWDIYGLRTRYGGQPIGGDFAIAFAGPQKRRTPAVVFNPSRKEYLVAWAEEKPNVTDDFDIKVQFLDALARPVGPAKSISTSDGYELSPRLAFNRDDNEYEIVWEAWWPDSDGPRIIYGRRLSATGETLDWPTVLCSECARPDIGYGDGQYLVVWETLQTDHNIYGRWIARGGRTSTSSFAVEQWQLNQSNPKVAFDSKRNKFLVVWEDHHWGWGADSDIYGRFIRGSDGVVDQRVGIAYAALYGNEVKRYQPSIVFNSANDEYNIFYETQDRPAAPSRSVTGRFVAADGSYFGPETTPDKWFPIEQSMPAAQVGPSGSGLVVYAKIGSTEHDIWAAPVWDSYERNSDRPGSDFRALVLPASEPDLCRAACTAETACLAWTYIKDTQVCWLKSGSVPKQVGNSNTISGVR